MEMRVEVRKAGNELLPLLILGLTSMALVAGMAFAVQEPDTAASIERSAQVAVGTLAAGAVAMFALLVSRGRPAEVPARATSAGLELGGRLERPGRAVYVVPDGARWSVENERLASVTRILVDGREDAERLAGAIAGRERVPAALFRLRKKADYYLFSATCCLWVLAYVGLVALPVSPVAGVLLLALSLPPTAWVTLRAVPTTVVLSPEGLLLLHPLRVRSVPAAEVAGGRVVDDDSVRIELSDGGALRLDELADHPRDREARSSARAAERLEAALEELLALRA